MAADHEKPLDFTVKKSVDESWKQSVEKEKISTPHPEQEEAFAPEGGFSFFVSSLAMQGLMFLGELQEPSTHQKNVDLPQAQYLIQTLEMLEEKTKGNLSAEESQVLKEALYALRLKFVEKTSQKT